MREQKAEIVKSGTWFYSGTVPYEVWIVRQNWDYYFEEGFSDGPEQPNPEGVVFHVLQAKDGAVVSGPSNACMTLEEAFKAAELKVASGITWDNHRLQPLFEGPKYKISA